MIIPMSVMCGAPCIVPHNMIVTHAISQSVSLLIITKHIRWISRTIHECVRPSNGSMDDNGPTSDTLELDLIEYLLRRRCVSPPTAKREEAIVRDHRGREGKKAVKRAPQRLMNQGIVDRTKKGKAGKIHYYVDPGEAKRILLDLEEGYL